LAMRKGGKLGIIQSASAVLLFGHMLPVQGSLSNVPA